MKTSAELSDRFRSAGRKVTPQRQAVFAALHGNTRHPTAEAIHAEVVRDLPLVSLRTVYQTLNDLAAMGEIENLDLGTGSARFDPNLTPHHHLVCDGCGAVQDLHVDYPDVAVPSTVAPGFSVSRTDIVFRGQCATCMPAVKVPTTTKHKEA